MQEEGVDEPDLVKTDGRTLFVVSDGRVSALDVRSRRPKLLGSLRLDAGWAHELLLDRSRLIVLSQGTPMPIADRRRRRDPRTAVAVPLADRAHRGRRRPAGRLRVLRTLELDGGYLTARLVGHVARVVLSSPIGQDLPFVAPGSPGAAETASATEQNRAVVQLRRREVMASLAYPPRAEGAHPGIRGRSCSAATSAGRRVSRASGMVTVLTVDLARGLDPIDADAIVSDGRVVYASRSSLYVATDRFDPRAADGRPVTDGVTTAIHRFDISSPTQTSYHGAPPLPESC